MTVLPFSLDDRLAADSLMVGDLPLCQVRLMDDSQFPWLVLVPRRMGVREIYELNPLVAMVECYRAVLYDLRFPSFGDFAYFTGWAFALFAFGYWVFSRLEPRLAEEV